MSPVGCRPARCWSAIGSASRRQYPAVTQSPSTTSSPQAPSPRVCLPASSTIRTRAPLIGPPMGSGASLAEILGAYPVTRYRRWSRWGRRGCTARSARAAGRPVRASCGKGRPRRRTAHSAVRCRPPASERSALVSRFRIDGTEYQTVTWCSRIPDASAATSRAWASSMIHTAAPAESPVNRSKVLRSKLKEAWLANTSSGPTSSSPRAQPTKLARFRCEILTPLGTPVDPEVYRMAARSPGRGPSPRTGPSTAPATKSAQRRTGTVPKAPCSSGPSPVTTMTRNDSGRSQPARLPNCRGSVNSATGSASWTIVRTRLAGWLPSSGT